MPLRTTGTDVSMLIMLLSGHRQFTLPLTMATRGGIGAGLGESVERGTGPSQSTRPSAGPHPVKFPGRCVARVLGMFCDDVRSAYDVSGEVADPGFPLEGS